MRSLNLSIQQKTPGLVEGFYCKRQGTWNDGQTKKITDTTWNSDRTSSNCGCLKSDVELNELQSDWLTIYWLKQQKNQEIAIRKNLLNLDLRIVKA